MKSLKDIEVIQGKPLELVCEVSGTPKPSATWFKGETEIKPDNELIQTQSVDNSHKLKIESSLESRDAGLYRVVFKNEFGSSESKSNVTVLSNYTNNLLEII